ncbi:MAG: hypothetical protein EXR60_06020 [Dehalococcoidia bacterium]|nr:hypothetical protein [Dehalococcoidia bacterium]
MSGGLRETHALYRFEDQNPVEEINVTLDYQREHKGKARWQAECLELGTAVYADTLEEARKELGEAILLQLTEIEKMGFIREFLEDHGVRPATLPTRPASSRGAAWRQPVIAR